MKTLGIDIQKNFTSILLPRNGPISQWKGEFFPTNPRNIFKAITPYLQIHEPELLCISLSSSFSLTHRAFWEKAIALWNIPILSLTFSEEALEQGLLIMTSSLGISRFLSLEIRSSITCLRTIQNTHFKKITFPSSSPHIRGDLPWNKTPSNPLKILDKNFNNILKQSKKKILEILNSKPWKDGVFISHGGPSGLFASSLFQELPFRECIIPCQSDFLPIIGTLCSQKLAKKFRASILNSTEQRQKKFSPKNWKQKIIRPEFYPDKIMPSLSSRAKTGKKAVWMKNKEIKEIPCYRKGRLRAGNMIEGPGLIESKENYIYIEKKIRAVVDPYLNIHLKHSFNQK